MLGHYQRFQVSSREIGVNIEGGGEGLPTKGR